MIKSKPKKKQVINPLETLVDFGKDTAKKTVREIVKTVNPLSGVGEKLFGNPTKKERENGNNNFTDLNFQKLQDQYDRQDKSKLDATRAQLGLNQQEKNPAQTHLEYHRRVQREEEEQNLKTEAEEEEKKRQEAMEEQQKKMAEEEARKSQVLEAPKGKVRKSILGGRGNRKATSELPPELRPGAGKQ